MNNSMVAHLWANEMKEFANGSNFYFEGESIYSYGSHLGWKNRAKQAWRKGVFD